MGFKKIRSIPLPEREQGLIRYTCLCHEKMPERTQRKIRRLCDEVGKDYAKALWRVMTSSDSITKIAMEEYCSEMTLYNLRRKFYIAW